MEWFIKAFSRASLLWFAAGIFLGVAIAVHPTLTLDGSAEPVFFGPHCQLCTSAAWIVNKKNGI